MFGLMLPKGFFQYSLMPQVMSRLGALLTGGFVYLPFFLAVVYRNFNLLPAHHPYLRSENIGRYGVGHVIAQALRNIKFSWRNIDQLVLFVVVLCGILIFFLQLLSLAAYFFLSNAHALPTNWAGFFTINPLTRSQDLASIMLDLVFGVPHPLAVVALSYGFFESCVGTSPSIPCLDMQVIPGTIPDTDLTALGPTTIPANLFSATSSGAAFPWPQHAGLHRLFSIYSNGLLVVACIMVGYFIATILAETAQTGTPFGRRYNKTWVPLRLVMAFGLLMPLYTGLNSAQYLVLYSAKYGSALATNGWKYFNSTLTTSPLGNTVDLVSKPGKPDVQGFLQFMFVANVCEVMYERMSYDHDGNDTTAKVNYAIEAYVHGPEMTTTGNTLLATNTTTYDDVVTMSGLNKDVVVITFGEKNTNLYKSDPGNVKPLCGQIRWTLADPRLGLGATGSTAAAAGPAVIQEGYWVLLRDLWFNRSTVIPDHRTGTVPTETDTTNRRDINFVMRRAPTILPEDGVESLESIEIGENYKRRVQDNVAAKIDIIFTAAVTAQGALATFGALTLPGTPLYNKGWAAAGIWYNKVAELNGNMTASAMNLPFPYKYPLIMERVWETKNGFDKQIQPKDRFTPDVAQLDDLSKYLEGENGLKVATVLGLAFKAYDAENQSTTHTKRTGNMFFDVVMMIFGTSGLYEMRENPTTHPLAQLVGLGKALIETSVRNLGIGTIAVAGGVAGADLLGSAGGIVSKTLASFFYSVAMITLTIGFLLFYILPFLPFIYFYFAVGGWIKGIFEAMVGAPLWALAHIRIDAHGLSGNAALNGYFLLFEIFVRPILIIFGLLASISIFAALVSVLNGIFPSVTSNLGGYNVGYEISPLATGNNTLDQMRGRIDQFFFTVMYAVVVYMIGMSSFKLIDTIPNNILRWMGSSVATFNDQREDAAQGLMSKASMGSQQVTTRIGGVLNKMAGLGGN